MVGSTREPKVFRVLALGVFGLMPVHVLLVFAIQARMGWGINDLSFVLVKSWKEVAALTVIGGSLAWRVMSRGKVGVVISSLDIAVLVSAMLGLVYVAISPNKIVGLWSYRSIYEIYLFYFMGRALTFTIEDYRRVFSLALVGGLTTAVFAVVQVEWLGPAFYYVMYGWSEIPLSLTETVGLTRMRATATFTSVHEFGLFMVLCMIFGSWLLAGSGRGRLRSSFLVPGVILLVGLYYSYSRSSMALAVGSAIAMGVVTRRPLLAVGVPLGAGLAGATVLVIGDTVRQILAGLDPSTLGRFDLFSAFLREFASQPLGSGLGTVGVVVRRFDPGAAQYEGELLNLALQTGVLGIIAYLLPIALIARREMSRYRDRGLSRPVRMLSGALLVVTMVLLARELVLPRDAMNYYLGWFLLGLSTTQPRLAGESRGVA